MTTFQTDFIHECAPGLLELRQAADLPIPATAEDIIVSLSGLDLAEEYRQFEASKQPRFATSFEFATPGHVDEWHLFKKELDIDFVTDPITGLAVIGERQKLRACGNRILFGVLQSYADSDEHSGVSLWGRVASLEELVWRSAKLR
jgi:hypothetical protein